MEWGLSVKDVFVDVVVVVDSWFDFLDDVLLVLQCFQCLYQNKHKRK